LPEKCADDKPDEGGNMQLDIRHVNLEVSDALREFTRGKMERALRPFQRGVERVDVRIQDVNGPRGGLDKRCTVTAELTATKRKVVVKTTSSDAYDAVQAACSRLGESVSRALTRRRQLDRVFARPRRADRPAQAAPPPEDVMPPRVTPPPQPKSRIQVTAPDHERLRRLVDTWSRARDRQSVEALTDELDRAEVVAAEGIAGDVITMNSRAVFKDEQTGESREVSLVYPQDSDADTGRISVLAPVGSALLGLSVGQIIDWPLPSGRRKRLRIVKVVYQPEQAGHLHL
jgi:regulator of nucleoside diphosphate kinase